MFFAPRANAQDEWKRGHELYKQGNYKEALVLFEEAVKTHPDWWFSIYLKGKCQFSLNKVKESITSFNEALTLEIPTDQMPVVKYDLARAQMAVNDYLSAIKSFTDLIDLAPSSRKFDLLYNRGQCELQVAKAAEEKKDKEKLISYYSKAIVSFSEAEKYNSKDPRLSVESLFQKAYCQFKIGNTHGTKASLEKCIGDFEQVLQKDKRHEDAHRFLIEVSFQLAKMASEREEAQAYGRTVGYISRYLEIWPNDAKMVNKKGQALQGQKKYADAVTVFKQYIKMQPKDGTGYFSLGSCQMASGDFDGAIESYKKAISNGAGDNQNVYTFAAYSFVQQKNDCFAHDIPLYEKAIEILRQGVKSNPGNGVIKRELDAKQANLQILQDNRRTEQENCRRALENVTSLQKTIAINEERLAANKERHIATPTAELQKAIEEGQAVIKESRTELERELKDLAALRDSAKRCGGAAATDLFGQMEKALQENGIN